jgi:4-amino-4-deoxy-L-arabinose transferase-like glycosyltransferase
VSVPAAGRRDLLRIWLPLVVILLAGIVLRTGLALHHQRVNFDEGRYLDNAVHLVEGGGLSTSTLSILFGDLPAPPRPEDISSPLYPLLLAGLFLATGPSFGAAKILSLLLSAGAILLTFLLARRLFGCVAGLLAAGAVALQPDQVIVGSWAMTESLYSVLLLSAVLAGADLAFPRGAPIRPLRVLGLGAILGLVYLTRQNGAAVAAALGALLLLGPRAAGERRARRLWLFLLLAATALAVASPWFARNQVRFGSPTFTRMKNVAWAEHGRSLYTPDEREPSLSRYVEEHGLSGLAGNLRRRAERVTRATLGAESGPFRWLALIALISPLIPALRPGAAAALSPALLSAALLLGVAPWSGALPRYLLPVRPLLYAAGAAVAVRAWAFLSQRYMPAGARRGVAAAVVVVLLSWSALAARPVLTGYIAVDQAAANALALEASDRIVAAIGPDDLLMEGGFLHQYAFRFRRGVVWVPYGDLETLFRVADRYGVRYLVITRDVIRFRPALAPHWAVEGERLAPLSVPARLEPVFDRAPEGLIIYRIAPESLDPDSSERQTREP